VTEEERETELRDWRRRRWTVLAEDGAVFGLNAAQSVELKRLEDEFGPTGLAEEFRS
jgi:hypothetical protein